MDIQGTRPNGRDPIKPAETSKLDRIFAIGKLLLFCVGVLSTAFLSLGSSMVRLAFERQWTILTKGQRPVATQKAADIGKRLLNPQDELRRNLTALIPEEQLQLILDCKEKFLARSSPRAAIYDYINGLTDVDGNPCAIGLDVESYEDYFVKMGSLVSKEKTGIRVSLQASGEQKISSKEDVRGVVFPLDVYLEVEENKGAFEALPKDCQEHIRKLATMNVTALSDEERKALGKYEDEKKNDLSTEQKNTFKKCVKLAEEQNAAGRGFVHFRSSDPSKSESRERIYIKMNKDRAHELVGLLILTLYGDQQKRYQGVLDIKVAGPQCAGRADGVVIYIGEAKKGIFPEEVARKNAIEQRDLIVARLKKLQYNHPKLFGDGPMPFKAEEGRGIATIPGVSSAQSFTEDLSGAIASALTQASDVSSLRDGVVDALILRASQLS